MYNAHVHVRRMCVSSIIFQLSSSSDTLSSTVILYLYLTRTYVFFLCDSKGTDQQIYLILNKIQKQTSLITLLYRIEFCAILG